MVTVVVSASVGFAAGLVARPFVVAAALRVKAFGVRLLNKVRTAARGF